MQRSTLLKFWVIGIPAILICYFFIDRPVAEFIYLHHWQAHLVLLKQVVEWPAIMPGLAPFLLLIAVLVPGRVEQQKWRRVLLLLSLSVLLTYVLKNDLKWIFSRYWPLTWTHDNLSWIGNHAYGFQWFQGVPFSGTDATGSFPSGHSAIAFATLLPIGFYHRRWLWLYVLIAALEACSMVAFDYHFLSDIIAGALVAITCVTLLHKQLNC